MADGTDFSEAAGSSLTSTHIRVYQTEWCHIPVILMVSLHASLKTVMHLWLDESKFHKERNFNRHTTTVKM
jgi:hypothetical protein